MATGMVFLLLHWDKMEKDDEERLQEQMSFLNNQVNLG